MRGGERGERRDADDLDLERPGDRLSGGKSDSDSREGAGSHRRRDAVERAEAALRRPDQALDERQQRFCVAALHGDRFGSERFGGVEIEDTAGNRGKGRVEGKNSHKREYDKFGGQTKAAGSRFA